MLNKLDHWHKTKTGFLFFAVLESALAYGFVSLAIDRGNILEYIVAIVFLVGGLQNLYKFVNETFWKVNRGR
jgi:hypothetical protein